MEEFKGMVNKIVVGLGGVGGMIVNEMVEELEMSEGVPRNEEFIVIDSNQGSLDECDRIKAENKMLLERPAVEMFREVAPFLPLEFVGGTGEGAGQHRLYGKALYCVDKSAIKTHITGVINDIRSRNKSDEFVFVFVGALGGGTGSGMIVDLPLDIRKWVTDTFHKIPLMVGLGVLPSSNEVALTIGNAMAALKELHFIMSHKKEVNVNEKDYSNPFKLFFLVDRTVKGVTGDRMLREILIRFLIDLGFVPGKKKQGKGKWLDLNDLQNRVLGLEHRFSTLGYYEVIFPESEILWYAEAERLLNDINTGINQKLAELEGELLTKKDKLSQYESRRENLENKIILGNDKVRSMESRSGWFSSKETIRKAKSEVQTAQQTLEKVKDKIRSLKVRIENLERKVSNFKIYKRDFETKMERVHDMITNPQQSVNVHRIGITEEERKRIQEENMLLGSYFKDIMHKLDRDEEYIRYTHKEVKALKIATNPMLNYSHTIPPGNIESNVRKILKKNGLITIDGDTGQIINEEEKLGHAIGVFSSDERNIEERNLGREKFQNIFRKYSAKEAEMLSLDSRYTRKYSTCVYSLMIGLHPWETAPGIPPRLADFVWLRSMYDGAKDGDEKELMRHHSLFYGDNIAFTKITDRFPEEETPEAYASTVTKFWKNYVVLDKESRWGQVPFVVGRIMVLLKELKDKLEDAESGIGNLGESLESEEFERHVLSQIRSDGEDLYPKLKEINDRMASYTKKFGDEQKYLDNVISQLRGIKDDQLSYVLKKEGAEKNKKLIEECLGIIADVKDEVETMSNVINDDLETHIRAIKKYLSKIPDDELKVPTVKTKKGQIERLFKKFDENIKKTGKRLIELNVPIDDIGDKIEVINRMIKKRLDMGQ
ncbi:MAG: hypothetical protein A7315_02240 [Candidatus Altiarchaeales archaeon WOR_SM1_79]|nr:MAG: hypothetical protein A7315_02240 [Candidatus Altiarchaeales archaeon WOR_SM1_79]